MKRLTAEISLVLSLFANGATIAACNAPELPPRTEASMTQPPPPASANATASAVSGPPAELHDSMVEAGSKDLGDASAAGGLGLSGVGQGEGGRALGLGAAKATHAPRIRQGATTVQGRLPQEVIQRIVRQNFGRFRLCYESGLRKDSKLTGMVTTRFVIDASGAVSSSESDASSTMPDADVAACVVRGFSNMSFPQPDAGTVTVVYPIIFLPGD
jgi:TonB family protein